MEIFMRNISFDHSQVQVITTLAGVLHRHPYTRDSERPLNFRVVLFKDKRGQRAHGGCGSLTLPTPEVGSLFYACYGGNFPRDTIKLGRTIMKFSKSRNDPKQDVIADLLVLPYMDPQVMEKDQQRTHYLQSRSVHIKTVQFGWDCVDNAEFSIEWEYPAPDCNCPSHLMFDDERREIRVCIPCDVVQDGYKSTSAEIAIRYTQIKDISSHHTQSSEPVIYMSFYHPPTFELRPAATETTTVRRRLSALPLLDHERVCPFTSLSMRLVCKTTTDLADFADLVETRPLTYRDSPRVVPVRLGLFSKKVMEHLQDWKRKIHWCVAFQVESLVRSQEYAAYFLRFFQTRLRSWNFYEDGADSSSIDDLFKESMKEYEKQADILKEPVSETSTFKSLHVIITPTSMILEGPYPEQSNRIIRRFLPKDHESFLRVSFMDEGRLQYRFDRDIDAKAFVDMRVGKLLREGLEIAKRTFRFLAYSQSALKEHSVWFMKSFLDVKNGKSVTASLIVKSIGRFDDATMHCPARYAARLSQAFTATDESITVEVEEIMPDLPDIETPDGRYCYTDGVGTISQDLARDIWVKLRQTRKRVRRSRNKPAAFQVRFQGSKGMLSVDHKLSGRAICLRKSMIKFQAPDSNVVEIARAFDRPGRYFLNRPLIMLLEALGVPYETFKKYQDMAVEDVHRATHSLENAARMLETYGLGTSFRLTSVLLDLEKLGIDCLPGDEFYTKMIEFAMNHVLRVLKNKARIPVPGAWTLVGVCDVHHYLKENEIFACVKPLDSNEKIFLEGPILISRSPTIHPGDAQVVNAIGPPPPDSPFAKQPLPNTVVFSVEGHRPVPSMLGGGDLDGDLYNLIPLQELPDFQLKRTYSAALYTPAPKKTVSAPSTMLDVADFVVDYIVSDVLGIIAINWLIIADQSRESILDENCLILSQLHSDAVDYPKSGQPVSLASIPRLKHIAKPDWNAPETVNINTSRYYPSQRAIGRLFRAIDLPAIRVAAQTSRFERERVSREAQPRRHVRRTTEDVADIFARMDLHGTPLGTAVAYRVGDFIDIDDINPERKDHILDVFKTYTTELQMICASNTLSHSRASFLTEEEAIIGTIVQKTSQPRRRADLMSKLREQTDNLVRRVREDLSGTDEDNLSYDLEGAWIAWLIAQHHAQRKRFGARSFQYIALAAIFEAIKSIESEVNTDLRGRLFV
ncbi:RdRP-domain-containing protein [Fistulina hepatica ATCC 64428]|uniref:RNA-dependent RNA polymerase n=1 Tax=Fistulina hepatica ATCC 64428 TaxID=1128425 RepID=A0A0D7A3W5_9AGAR|nr:RdRP-domain-containing protein [Fistulina hepatica ATCC 64428]